jgi:hypothetical protein
MSLIAMRRDEGLSYREMAAAMKARHRVSVSYRTIQNWFRSHHPELAEEKENTDAAMDSAAPAPPPAAAAREAPQAGPAEDLAALRAALDELAMKHRHLQARSAAQEAEIIALTGQRPTPEVQPPMPSLPAPVYSGSWEHDLPMLPGEPIDITPVQRPRLLRNLLTLGVIVVLLALCLLAFYTAFQDTLARAYAAAMHSPHLPFAVLAASMVVAGLGLGLRAKAFVPALLALATYLLMLRNAHIPFFIAVVLTLQVSKALINDR